MEKLLSLSLSWSPFLLSFDAEHESPAELANRRESHERDEDEKAICVRSGWFFFVCVEHNGNVRRVRPSRRCTSSSSSSLSQHTSVLRVLGLETY